MVSFMNYRFASNLPVRAAAHRRVVEANVAAATRFAARLQAVAERLNHGGAGLVARRAANAAAVLRVLALRDADREIALAAGDAVPSAIAAAQSVGQHAAEVLQRAAGDFVVAPALDLTAAGGLLEFHGAARQHAPIGCRR